MTPPLNPVKGPPVPNNLPPLPTPTPAPTPSPVGSGKSSYVALDGGNAEAFKSKDDLVAALSDARLFGAALKDYEAGKDGKYLRVNLALDAIRSAITSDGSSAIAVQRITMWLSDSTLLTDKAVAHVARVNLVKALEKAPKSAGLDEKVKVILEALKKNHSSSAPAKKEEATAPSAAEAPKSLGSQLEDSNLFGERFKEYDAKRNKEYVAVNLALVEIRKLATGKTKDADPVKLRIERWLGDSALLTDKVPHQARVNLIKILGAAPSTEGIATIIAALKADYSKSAPAKKEEAPPAPSEVQAKTEKGVTTYSSKPNSKLKAKREDTTVSFQNGMGPVIRPVFQRYLKSNESGLSAEMTVTVDGNGAITDVSFTNVKAQAGEDTLKNFFRDVANALRSRFLFKASTFDSGDFGFIKANIKFVAQ